MTEFLVRVYRDRVDKRSPYIVAEQINVRNPVLLKATGNVIGGLFKEVESTGRRNRKRLSISVVSGTTARGSKVSPRREQVEAAATAAGVKQVCRRLRPQEAEAIARADRRIAQLEGDLRRARDGREQDVKAAWAKAHVVRLAEMQDRIGQTAAQPRQVA